MDEIASDDVIHAGMEGGRNLQRVFEVLHWQSKRDLRLSRAGRNDGDEFQKAANIALHIKRSRCFLPVQKVINIGEGMPGHLCCARMVLAPPQQGETVWEMPLRTSQRDIEQDIRIQ